MINLHNRDCMDAMKEMPDNYYELAIVDPPYGIDLGNMNMDIGKSKKASKKRTESGRPKIGIINTPTRSILMNYLG